MKKRITAAASLMLLLCGCSSDNVNRPEEITETVVSEIVISEVTDKLETTDVQLIEEMMSNTDTSQAEEGVMIQSVQIHPGSSAEEWFIGTNNDSSDCNGTIELRVYDSERKLTDTYILLDDESFYYYNYFGNEDGIECFYPSVVMMKYSINGTYYHRFFEITGKGDIVPIKVRQDSAYQDIIYDAYTLISRGFTASLNQIGVEEEGKIKNEYDSVRDRDVAVIMCYDYGNNYMGDLTNRYVEYLIDCRNDELRVKGSISYKGDEELYIAALKAINRKNLYLGCAYMTYAYDYMNEVISETVEVTRRRVDKALFADREEVKAYFTEGFSKSYIEKNYKEMDEVLFEGKYEDPIFEEDSEGLIFVDRYRGVPVRYDLDSFKVIRKDDISADAIILGGQIDEIHLDTFRFVKENGEWKLDSIESGIAGRYFE